MTPHRDDFSWIDLILKRWQIWVALIGGVMWITTMQIQLAAATEKISKVENQMTSFGEIRAEWPYMKSQVSRIENKVDRLLQR